MATLHRLRDREPSARPAPRIVTLPSAPRDLSDEVLERIQKSWKAPAALERHAHVLGVRRGSLETLLAWAEADSLYIPQFDHERRVVGVRVRHLSGAKWAWKDGREGVFLATPGADGPVLLPEGPSSSAALLDLSFAVIGRPSAKPGTLAMASLRELVRGRDVVLLAENDAKPSGAWPGREGAEYTAKGLLLFARSVRIIFPPNRAKDARDAIRAGWSRTDIEAAIAAVEPLGMMLVGGASHE